MLSGENNALIILIGFLLCLCGLLLYRLLMNQKALNERRAQDARWREERRLVDVRNSIGNYIANAMRNAADAKPKGNVRVEVIKKNGHLGYSILVTGRDSKTYLHLQPIIAQIDVMAGADGIHVLHGAHGPDTTHPADNASVEKIIKTISKKISEY